MKLLGNIMLYPAFLLMRMAVGLMAGAVFMLIVVRWLKK